MKIVSFRRIARPMQRQILREGAADRGLRVIIAGAGGAAHLAGVIAAHTWLPVLGVPIQSKLQGLDSLLSTAQMPGGIPVGTLAIGEAGAKNAALLAAAILATSDQDDSPKLGSVSQKTIGSGIRREIAKVKTAISTDRAAAVEQLRKGDVVALPNRNRLRTRCRRARFDRRREDF